MSVDIAYVVSHGFASRMVTQTDLLKSLADRGLKVALISSGKDSLLEDYCSANRVSYHVYQAGLNWSSDYLLKRRYMTGDSTNNVALRDKHIHDVYYSKRLNPLRRLKAIYYYYLSKENSSGKSKFLLEEKQRMGSEKAIDFLKTLSPKWLVSTYPVDMMEGELLHNASTVGINTCIHLLSWDNITCKGRFPSLSDKYISWGKIMSEELQQYYNVAPENILECGVPHFDLHAQLRNSGRYHDEIIKLGLSPELPYVMFAMSSPYFAPGEIDIVEYLGDRLENTDIQLLVRPHPQNLIGEMADLTWVERLNSLNQLGNTAVDFPDLNRGSEVKWSMQKKDMERMSLLISGSKIVLNSGSTMSIDALMHFKPVIITAFDGEEKLSYWKSARRLIDFPHLRKLISYKGISVVENFTDLESEIRLYLKNDSYKKEQRNATLDGQIRFSNGSATKKVEEVLSTWIK